MGRIVSFFLTCGVAVGLAGALSSAGATTTTQAHHRKSTRLHSTRHVVHRTAKVSTRLVRGRDGKLHRVAVRHRYYEHFTGDSYAETDITAGDITAGEDPVVRAAAIAALGNMNGTAVAIDPGTGRILAMVNQKLALSSGAEPCSTIKVSVALAALEEGIVTKDTPVNLGGWSMTMTEALAHSNNLYFETMGRRLGFERVRHYANRFGLGELAGWNIPGEQLGVYPNQELPEKLGGVGRMCSFGQSISMTPLQLGALTAAIANGGTLYYLQHPTTPAEAVNFTPRVKRELNIKPFIPDVASGMGGAVAYGTARSLRASFNQLPVLGKTGTCSENGTVFFLEGGRPTFGPKAAELTGVFYRNLWEHSYFAEKNPTEAPAAAAIGQSSTATGVIQ
jgi:penicillin-binding protein 2